MVRVATSAWIALAVVLVAGCGGASGVAERIRAAHSPLVEDVEYTESLFGSNVIRVYLVAGATEAQGHGFRCSVVVPAAGRDLATVAIVVDSSDPPQAGSTRPWPMHR